MNKTLTVIIPVSAHEQISTIQSSMIGFKYVNFDGFDHKVVYCIDIPEDTRPYWQNLKIYDNMEILWVTQQKDLELKQAGAYNAGIREYPNSEYYAFFDVDAIPCSGFFQECAQVDANFVTGHRHVYNEHQNYVTETVSEEYELCNAGRVFMYKYVNNYFPASCTGLIQGVTLSDFMFTEKTSADSELYRHILRNGFSMGYAHDTYYIENAPYTTEQLYSQRLRWLQDTWRTWDLTIGSGNFWEVNIANLLMYSVGMLPVVGCIALLPYAKHLNGYNFIYHSMYMQYISLIALGKVIKGGETKWEVSER